MELIDTGQQLTIPGVKKKQGSAYQRRQGDTFSELNTSSSEWTPCSFYMSVGDPPTICWKIPKGYKPVSTRFGIGEEACQLCGARIKNHYYIQHDKCNILMVVGCECYENHSLALAPEDQDRWTLAKRAYVNPQEVKRVQRVMDEKGWPMETALVAVRAWSRLENKWRKDHPIPNAAQQKAYTDIKDEYWRIRNDPTHEAHGMQHREPSDSERRRTAWRYWCDAKPTPYAFPGPASLKECWEQKMKEYIGRKVNEALKRRDLI